MTKPEASAAGAAHAGSFAHRHRLLALMLGVALLTAAAVTAIAWNRATRNASIAAQLLAQAWARDQGDVTRFQRLVESVDLPAKSRVELLDGRGSVLVSVGATSPVLGELRAGAPVPQAPSGARPAATLQGADGPSVRLTLSAVDALMPVVEIALISVGAGLVMLGLALRRSRALYSRVESRAKIDRLTDSVTGLLNRSGLNRQLDKARARASARAHRLGVLLIDLDRFHLVNESFGAPAGDAVLREAAQRLRAILRESDVAARLGADQFLVASATLVSPDAAAVFARNILRALLPSYQIGGQEIAVTASIGVALAGPTLSTPQEIIAAAEVAMRHAKTTGAGRYCLFEPEMLVNRQRELTLEVALRSALSAREFELVYQPIVTTGDGRIVAVEALLRWQTPRHGNVPPSEFIPILEHTGMIVDVGDWVLREAARRVHGWIQRGAPPVIVSVNVSPLQFADPDFVARTLATLVSVGLSPRLLQLEVTEGVLLDPSAGTLAKLDALANAGVRLAVDDFGMGYSSLAYLKRFRLHALKIDRMFVNDVLQAERDGAVVKAMVDLAHALGLNATAEGVETAAQAQRLTQFGCDFLQGYWIDRPMSAQACFERLAHAAGLQDEPRQDDWSTTLHASLELDPQ